MKKILNHISFYLHWAALLAVPKILCAQELPVQQLEEVEIKQVRLSEYAVGARTTNLDSSLLELNQTASLAELLQNYTATHIKSHGNGMLSTISFRGTGAEHTAVLWHGVNISYPMLGQADFSLIPVALNDQIQIQHGTGSSLYGSGALGGTIAVSSTLPTPGLSIDITQWLGSFGTLRNNAQLSIANKRAFIKLSTVWNKSANDFSFVNSTKPGTPEENQGNANYQQLGVGLESGISLGEKGELLISGQYLEIHRQLQPSMNVSNSTDWQDDINLRLRARYQYQGEGTNWHLQYAFTDDEIVYNGATTKVNQQVFRGEVDQQINDKIKASFAADHSLVGVKAQFYTGEQASETRTNLWASILTFPKPWLMFSANLRQSFHPVYQVPFSPSLGAEFRLKESGQSTHTVSFMAARGFRIPTLNELYWEPGGNLNLQPEDSYSVESGIKGQIGESVKLEYNLTGYRMWVSNWILWRPNGNFWAPENIREVDVYGIELSGSINHRIGAAIISWQGNYAYTKSINRTGFDQFDRSVGKQLSYTPIHKGGLMVEFHWRSWSFLANGVAIGERFTTSDNENSLPAYFLLDFKASKQIKLGAHELNVYGAFNNLLNTDYQSVVNKAMPGINYLIGVNLTLIKPEL